MKKLSFLLAAFLTMFFIGCGNSSEKTDKQNSKKTGDPNLRISNDGTTVKGVKDRDVTTVVIPSGVTSIGDCAFLGCENLTSVTIPPSVTSIGLNAFFHCEKLTTIALSKHCRYPSNTFESDCKIRFYDAPALTSLSGIDFGEVFSAPANTREEELSDGSIRYKIVPPKQFMSFSECYVYVTPKTRKIYKIEITAEVKNRNKGEILLEQVTSVMAEYWKINAIDGKFLFSDGELRLRLYDVLEYTVHIDAVSDECVELYENEKREIREAVVRDVDEVDTSAL
ncbi:MAG: leucine-rich repeat domain-containing protein [Lentisphaeria bacterium]|nr:leucine-rich repeat domain-containing protein [Lentisphaeria bacterium]